MTRALQPVVYLAGPEVFFPDASSRGQRLKALCAQHGLHGIFPLDGATPDEKLNPVTIRMRCLASINAADAVVANISPFRGAHMDPGTAWEVGYAEAQGKPVFLWSTDTREMVERIRGTFGPRGMTDLNGHLIENFGKPENLMITAEQILVYDTPQDAIRAAAESLVHWRVQKDGMRLKRKVILFAILALMAAVLASSFLWR